MKQKMVLALSVVIGLVAFWLTSQYIQTKRQEYEDLKAQFYAGAKMVWVLAAGRDLPAETVLQQQDLRKKESLGRDAGKNTLLVEDLDKILGKKLKYSLEKGDTLLWSYVDVPYRTGSGLAPTINPTMRAISISVGGAAAVSGLVQPNDRVDILGSFSFPSKTAAGEMENVTLTVLQDVTVLATGQQLAKPTESGDAVRPGGGYSTVTLEVSPREAELLVFAETMKGRLTLSLRNPADVSYENALPEVNFEHIEKKLPELNQIRQELIRHKRKM